MIAGAVGGAELTALCPPSYFNLTSDRYEEITHYVIKISLHSLPLTTFSRSLTVYLVNDLKVLTTNNV